MVVRMTGSDGSEITVNDDQVEAFGFAHRVEAVAVGGLALFR